jgi:hypothetical protein
MEKKELKEEIKKVLEGKSIYEMSPISGLNPMTKEEIIYWIVETYIDQELDKAKIEVLTEIFQTCYQEDSKTRELVEEKLSKLKDKK